MSRWCLPAALAAVLFPAQTGLGAPAPPLRPARTVTLPPFPGDPMRQPIVVTLPRATLYPRGSAALARYLKGYVEGYADAVLPPCL